MIRRLDDRGAVTAEFAVVIPTAVLVVLLAVAALSAAGTQVRLEHAAAQAARLAARGEGDARAVGSAAVVVPGATVTIDSDGDIVCAQVVSVRDLPVPLPALRARACALAGGG